MVGTVGSPCLSLGDGQRRMHVQGMLGEPAPLLAQRCPDQQIRCVFHVYNLIGKVFWNASPCCSSASLDCIGAASSRASIMYSTASVGVAFAAAWCFKYLCTHCLLCSNGGQWEMGEMLGEMVCKTLAIVPGVCKGCHVTE